MQLIKQSLLHQHKRICSQKNHRVHIFKKRKKRRLLKQIQLYSKANSKHRHKDVLLPLASLTNLIVIVTCQMLTLVRANFVPTTVAQEQFKKLLTLLFPTDSTTLTQSAAKISLLLETKYVTLAKLEPVHSKLLEKSQSKSDTTNMLVTLSKLVKRLMHATTEKRRDNYATMLPRLHSLAFAKTIAIILSDQSL